MGIESNLYFPFVIRLYGFTLFCLCDGNFTGMDLFYHIKDCVKGREDPHNLLFNPLEKGLAFKLAEWSFEKMFEIDEESGISPYMESLDNENFIWFLSDFFEAASQSGCFKNVSLIKKILGEIEEIGSLYETNETTYWRKVKRSGRISLIDQLNEFLDSCSDEELANMRGLYAYPIADRILHDRELCSFVAETVMDIGFDGETVEGMRSQWVERSKWPQRVKDILIARDRGKCALCGVDIINELSELGNIDHIFPLSGGGCNDLVNLQLLCSHCNSEKRQQEIETRSSVPQYIRRLKTRKI